MVAEVYAGLGAFKAMFDIAKGLKDIHDATVRNGAIIELQQQILAAQSEQSSLIERLHVTEKQLAELRTWEVEKQRYQLEKLPPGVFVMSLRSETVTGEPQHSICVTCYEHGKKSILHSDKESNGIYHLKCHECGILLRVGYYITPRVKNLRSADGNYTWMAR